MDKLEKMKEEHSRITQRHIQELLLQQYARENNVSLSVARAQTAQQTPQQLTAEQLPANQGVDAQALLEGNLRTAEKLRRERGRDTGLAHRDGGYLGGARSLIEDLGIYLGRRPQTSSGQTRVPTMGRETIPETLLMKEANQN